MSIRRSGVVGASLTGGLVGLVLIFLGGAVRGQDGGDGGPPDGVPPLDAADSNDDGTLNITDPVTTLGALFLGSGPLPPPSAAIGFDPTPDTLFCQ